MKKVLFAALCCMLFSSSFVLGAVKTSAIDVAAAKGDIAKIKVLLKKNPKLVNDRDKDGAAPLHYAAASGGKGAVELLIAGKADVNAHKKDGVTPLQVAAAMGQKEVVQVLLSHKADCSAKDNKGRTALSLAQERGQTAIAQILQACESMGNMNHVSRPVMPMPVQPGQQPGRMTDVVLLAKNFVTEITKGEFVKATLSFDDTMKTVMSPDSLRQTWSSLVAQTGPFIRQSAARTEKSQGMDIVYVTCEFQNGKLDAKVVFNSENRISGLWFVPPAPVTP